MALQVTTAAILAALDAHADVLAGQDDDHLAAAVQAHREIEETRSNQGWQPSPAEPDQDQ